MRLLGTGAEDFDFRKFPIFLMMFQSIPRFGLHRHRAGWCQEVFRKSCLQQPGSGAGIYCSRPPSGDFLVLKIATLGRFGIAATIRRPPLTKGTRMQRKFACHVTNWKHQVYKGTVIGGNQRRRSMPYQSLICMNALHNLTSYPGKSFAGQSGQSGFFCYCRSLHREI